MQASGGKWLNQRRPESKGRTELQVPRSEPPQGAASIPDVANANRRQSAGISQPATEPAPTVKRDEPPWLPLLVVSLSLMGSLSANLFLGWSYVDARHKYRTLVRKTADKFRRAAA